MLLNQRYWSKRIADWPDYKYDWAHNSKKYNITKFTMITLFDRKMRLNHNAND